MEIVLPPLYEIRRSRCGWSIDKKINGHWTFMAKFRTAKDATSWAYKHTESLK